MDPLQPPPSSEATPGRRWRAVHTTVRAILLLTSLFYFFSFPGADSDLWGHLRFGREIVSRGALPPTNLYSYTAPDSPWINHEWLAEVVFSLVYGAFGSRGLILFKVIAGALIIGILDLVLRRRGASPYPRCLALVSTMAIVSAWFDSVRPQIFTYVLLALLLLLLQLHEEGHRSALYWAVPVMAIWLNLHGGVLVGVAVLAAYVISTIGWGRTDDQGRRRAGRALRALSVLGLSVAALAANPYGLDLPRFLMRDVLLDRPIVEWQPVVLLDASEPVFKLALLAVLATAILTRSLRRWDVFLSLLGALAAIQHQRHVALFGILAAPILAQGIEGSLRWLLRGEAGPGWVRLGGGLGAAGLLSLAVFQALWIGTVHWSYGFRIAVSELEYPVQAADFMERNGIRGNMAIHFDWGEYAIWKLYPGTRVSMDGRYTTAYPPEVVRDWRDWFEARPGWRNLLERYPTDLALIPRDRPIGGLLQADPEWVLVYVDPLAALLVRNTPAQQDVLARFRAGRLVPPGPPQILFPG